MDVTSRVNRLTYEVPMPDGDKRLRELIVYIADKCQDDPKFGATKLNKILFYADHLAFARYGQPITGAKYQRLERGPAPVRLRPVQAQMERDGDIVVRKREFRGRAQHRTIATRGADLTIFNGREIALVDEVIGIFWEKTAAEVSDVSHGISWLTRYNGDPIPYEAIYLSDEPVTPGDISRTEELVREFDWNVQRV